MAVYSLTGNDTFILDGFIIDEFADQSTITIEYGNAKVGHTTGKNGNTIFSTDKQGDNATVTLRLMAGGKNDILLNGKSLQQDRDLPSFPPMTATFAKRIGDGTGKVKYITYNLEGGVFENNVGASENLQGDTEQGIAVYTLFFAKAVKGVA